LANQNVNNKQKVGLYIFASSYAVERNWIFKIYLRNLKRYGQE